MRATKTPTVKARKGSVSVLSFQNRLRLQFRVDGKQRSFSLGLDDTPEDWKEAEIRSYQVEEFKAHLHYQHYYYFVFFKFASGVRTGEAIGLCWKHISDNFSTIWIGESVTKGERKSTKTNKARVIPANDVLLSQPPQTILELTCHHK